MRKAQPASPRYQRAFTIIGIAVHDGRIPCSRSTGIGVHDHPEYAILWQFLLEAVFLTAIGGALGLLLGSAVGIGVHFWTGFPISLPWWSFAIAIGFSATVGIVFGLYPAIRASGLDPIEALRYE